MIIVICQGRTSSTVRRHDLDTLMTSLKEISSPIHIFRPSLWLHQTITEVRLCQSNTTYALFGHTCCSCMHVQSSMSIADLPLCQVIWVNLPLLLAKVSRKQRHISSSSRFPSNDSCIVMSSHISRQPDHFGLLGHINRN